MLTTILIFPLYQFLSGLIFALQFFSFLAFCIYFANETCFMSRRVSLMELLRTAMRRILLHYGIIRITQIKPDSSIKKKTLNKLKEELQLRVMKKDSFETADWLNALLFEILCTSKSRRLIDSDQEALLLALTRISREAIESKLSDYQRDSWLFLNSLDLESFSFGDRLPLVQNVRLAYFKTNSLAIVMDVAYSGGIKVGLKAAVAMNLRDFATSINFTPSKFKLILKMDAEPTPRISLMLSEVPAYEIAVTMKSQQMDRVSNLLKLIIGNFIRSRLCYPNYLTVLFRAIPNGPFAQIANSKQYQSQLRVRLVSLNLNYSDGIADLILPAEEINVMAVVSLGDVTSKTEIINAELSNTRWNSIHTFNVFNGLETSPKCLQISLYQVITDGSFNHLGKTEILYSSITPGILDVRTLPISSDRGSTVSLEMYLHHMEDDGEKDASWIFWNCPRPAKRRPEQEKSIEQVNWDTIKFVISKLSTDTHEESDDFDEISDEDYDILRESSSKESISYQVTENLFELIEKSLTKCINRLFNHDPLNRTIDVLTALRLELEDFATKFNLNRPPLSAQALSAHNERLTSLLRPLMKSFLPEALNSLKDQDSFTFEKVKRDLNKIFDLVNCKEVEVTNESSPDLLNNPINPLNEMFLKEFYGFWGDLPVQISIDQLSGITLKSGSGGFENEFFDFEGIFYAPNESNLKAINLASTDLFNSSAILATWEVVLLKNRFLSFIPLGRPHLFPSRLIDVFDIVEIEVIKDRDAFSLGFNADLSSKEAFHHANNGILRMTFKDGERLDLLGESRTCDQWFCILSCRLEKGKTLTFPWKEISKIWLLPLNIPSLTCPYALAVRHESKTFVILNSDQIYRAYCTLKTIWLSKGDLLTFDLIKRDKNSSNSSLTASPKSQKSSLLSLKSLASSFSSVTSANSAADPFASKTRFDRLKMSSASSKSEGSNGTAVMMTSIDDLKMENPLRSITENSASFNCTLNNFPPGHISVGPDFICYWPRRYRNPSGLPTQNQFILLLPRAAILDVSKTTPNWVSAFCGIVLKVKRQFYQSPEPIVLSGFNSLQEMELVFDNLIGIN